VVQKPIDQFQVYPSDHFRATYEQTLRTHYSVNAIARNKFEDLIATFWQTLQIAPRKVAGASPEPWPPGKQTSRQGFDFYKFRFSMPELRGAAKLGRIMYLVHNRSATVRLVWIYTHDEFSGRPADADLKPALLACKEAALEEIKARPLELLIPGKATIRITARDLE
jgi:hypothetical protein